MNPASYEIYRAERAAFSVVLAITVAVLTAELLYFARSAIGEEVHAFESAVDERI